MAINKTMDRATGVAGEGLEPPEDQPQPTAVSRRIFRMPSARFIAITALIAILAYLVLLPIAMIVWGSFRDSPPGVAGSFTLEKYVLAYTTPRFLRAVWNSLVFAVSSSILAFVVGTYLAWITERTNTPLRGVTYALVLLPVIVPGVLTTIAWVLILNPTIGVANAVVNVFVETAEPVFTSYGMWAMIWADGMDSITLPFLLMAAAFRGMDPSLEEASETSGAAGWFTMRHVTLPILTPAVLAVFLLLFIKTIETFEVPAIMGIPAGITVFATEVWLASQNFPRDYNLAGAFAVGYLAVTILGLALYYRATNLSAKFATITGKGFKPTRIDLGVKKWLHFSITMLLLFVAVVLPFLIMLYTSVIPFYVVPSLEALSRFTWNNYEYILTANLTLRALKNTLIVGLSSSVVVVVLSAVISWVVIRTTLPLRKLLDAVAFAPIAVPGLVMGLALIWVYLTFPDVGIYGTLWILGLGFVAKYIPYGMRASHASLTQIDKELEEASAASGASWLRTFGSIIAPLISSGLLVAFIYVLSLTFKVLSLPIMLSGTNTEVLSVLIFDLFEGGEYPRLNALGVLMFLILLALSALSRMLQKRFGHVEVNT